MNSSIIKIFTVALWYWDQTRGEYSHSKLTLLLSLALLALIDAGYSRPLTSKSDNDYFGNIKFLGGSLLSSSILPFYVLIGILTLVVHWDQPKIAMPGSGCGSCGTATGQTVSMGSSECSCKTKAKSGAPIQYTPVKKPSMVQPSNRPTPLQRNLNSSQPPNPAFRQVVPKQGTAPSSSPQQFPKPNPPLVRPNGVTPGAPQSGQVGEPAK